MARSVAHVLAQMQRWTTAAHRSEISDAVLLERYVHRREESAFAALVARHGGMVLRLCRRVLSDAHAAEDAFQAVFLILARKAHSLKKPEALSAWLHGVARRVALKARRQSSGLSSSAPLDEALPDLRPDPLTQLTARELLDILDQEVQRLPAPQRSAVVLCCLEGRTREEAAGILGWTIGSLRGHLERGRQRLQERLARRGITLSAALAIAAVSHGEGASVLLLRSTVTAAMNGGLGNSAAALAHSVLKGMLLTKLAAVMTVVMAVALAASTTLAFVYRGSVVENTHDTPPVAAAPKEPVPSKPRIRTDALGDPLPDGAIARLGTVRFRHGEKITFAAFAPDGKRLVSRGDDGVRVWDVATGKQLRHFAPQPGKNWGASDVSSDGKTLAAASESGAAIDFWDISSGKKTFSLGRGKYTSVRLSPNGKWLAAFSAVNPESPVVELWDAVGRRKLRSWKPQGEPPLGMNFLFSADSQKLLTSGRFGKAILWDTENGRQLHEFKRLDEHWNVSSWDDAISPDGKLVALFESAEMVESKAGAVEWKARISLHDAMTGKRVRLLTRPSQGVYPQGRGADFSALTFTADGKKLLTGGPDRFLRIWDAATGAELQRWPLELGRPELLTLSGDGKTLAAVMLQGKAIQFLDMAGGKPRHSLPGHLSNICLSALTPDCRTAVTSDGGGKMFVWDAAAGRIRRVLKGHEGSPIFSLQLAADGQTLYSVGWDKNVRVWDLSTGEERRRFSLGPVTPFEHDRLALSPDGNILAVLNSEKSFRLLDTTSGRELRRFQEPKAIHGGAFTADGRSLVVWSGGPKVGIWDVRTGRLLRDYPLPKELVMEGAAHSYYSAAISSDGRLLACGTYVYRPKHFLVLKDLATGRDVHRLDNFLGAVVGLAFSPDGRVLAWSGTKDGSIHLMETASGGERCRLPGHPGAEMVFPLAFSADGTRLISGSGDTTVLIWDVRDPAEQPPAIAAELQALWTDLAGKDAVRAYRAIRKLAVSPTSAIPFFRKLLRPAPALDEKRLTRLIADLDSDDFSVRQKAVAELEKLDERALPVYRTSLEGKPSLETRRRLQDLVGKAGAAWWDVSGERLRSLRAVEALELAGTEPASELLKTLAAGAEGARLTVEAKAALERLAQQARK